jgi:hypothetical protein
MNSAKSLFNNNRIRPVMILVLGLSLAGTARAQSSETINQLFAFPLCYVSQADFTILNTDSLSIL